MNSGTIATSIFAFSVGDDRSIASRTLRSGKLATIAPAASDTNTWRGTPASARRVTTRSDLLSMIVTSATSRLGTNKNFPTSPKATAPRGERSCRIFSVPSARPTTARKNAVAEATSRRLNFPFVGALSATVEREDMGSGKTEKRIDRVAQHVKIIGDQHQTERDDDRHAGETQQRRVPREIRRRRYDAREVQSRKQEGNRHAERKHEEHRGADRGAAERADVDEQGRHDRPAEAGHAAEREPRRHQRGAKNVLAI